MTCCQCGETGKHVEVCRNGETVALGTLCDYCFAVALEEAAQLRKEFEALLACGLSREDANARMIAKIEGRGALA